MTATLPLSADAQTGEHAGSGGAPLRALRSRSVPWELASVLGTVALALVLNTIWLDRQAYGNTYYAATVKSMLSSWSAFLFAAFDGGGFVTVDKPPAGLWVQAASAKLFGFSGLSILLPQAIAGVLSVVLLWWLVRRAYGPAAGLVAGLALAVTPISVVTSRNNTMDAQLILLLLLAVWAGSVAAERGRLRLLVLSAVLVGLAYNVKMLQAYLALPAIWAAYLVSAPLRWPARLAHLTAATLLLLSVSLSWSVAVDLLPPDARPYVGSSGSNSAVSLALGYNGLGRLTQAVASRLPIPGLAGLTVDLTAAPGFAPGIGNPGALRLFSDALAEQSSWLLPLALAGLGLSGWQLLRSRARSDWAALRTADRQDHRRKAVALMVWGLWLAACIGYFSFARFYHLYYLIMLGPPVSALAGIGVVAGWRAYRDSVEGECHACHPDRSELARSIRHPDRSELASEAEGSHDFLPASPRSLGCARKLAPLGMTPRTQRNLRNWLTHQLGRVSHWMLPLLLLGCAAVQAGMLLAFPAWGIWLTPLVLGLSGVAALVLVMRQRAADARVSLAAAAVGCLALLIAPTVWSGISVWNNNGAAWLPEAGPSDGGRGPMGLAFGSTPRPGGPGGAPGGGRFGAGGPIGPGGQAGPGGPFFGPGAQPPAFAGRGPGAGAPQIGQGGGTGPAGQQARSGIGGPGGGPGGPGGPGGRGGPGALTFAGDQWNSLDPGLVQYLLAHQGAARFLVATPTSSYASLFMLATDQPAMALGGYQGWDRILTPEQLAQKVAAGTVRFFWISGAGNVRGPGMPPHTFPNTQGQGRQPDNGQQLVSSSQDATGDLLAWVRDSCTVVPAEVWQTGNQDARGNTLYDCAALIRE